MQSYKKAKVQNFPHNYLFIYEHGVVPFGHFALE
jgi:hypothetical protein